VFSNKLYGNEHNKVMQKENTGAYQSIQHVSILTNILNSKMNVIEACDSERLDHLESSEYTGKLPDKLSTTG
jgi:hypothetical protein